MFIEPDTFSPEIQLNNLIRRLENLFILLVSLVVCNWTYIIVLLIGVQEVETNVFIRNRILLITILYSFIQG